MRSDSTTPSPAFSAPSPGAAPPDLPTPPATPAPEAARSEPAPKAQAPTTAAQKRRSGRFRVEGVRCDRGEPLDMSLEGMRLRTRRSWPVGESREVCLRTSSIRLTLSARCAWAQREGLLRHTIGVIFDGTTPAQRETIAHLARTHAARVERRSAA